MFVVCRRITNRFFYSIRFSWFYILFEGILIPMFLIIGIWGFGEGFLLLIFLYLGGSNPFSSEICNFFCTCHNFSPLSSVQIIIIPACCLLCVL